ncbi:MAG: hypothetical protein OXE78_11880 [Gammaproteobacteria bacterium]|nr:hypothetical protein [Gammaproteobacteria bacterium]
MVSIDCKLLPRNNEVGLWRVSTVSEIPRCAKDMENKVALLPQACREIIFIDPYFGPESSRFRQSLIEFLKTAKLNRTSEITRVEYHLRKNMITTILMKIRINWQPKFLPLLILLSGVGLKDLVVKYYTIDIL